MLAAQNAHISVVKLLLSHNAEVDLQITVSQARYLSEMVLMFEAAYAGGMDGADVCVRRRSFVSGRAVAFT